MTLSKNKGKILGQVMVALDTGTLVREDLINLLRETDPSLFFSEPAAGDVPHELIVAGWTIDSRNGDIADVSRGSQHGYTYAGKGNDNGFRRTFLRKSGAVERHVLSDLWKAKRSVRLSDQGIGGALKSNYWWATLCPFPWARNAQESVEKCPNKYHNPVGRSIYHS